MKRVNFSVRRNLPAFSQSGNRSRGFWIKPRQAFKQTCNDATVYLRGDDGRVKRFRLATIDDGDIRRWFLARAAGSQKTEDGNQMTSKKIRCAQSLNSGFRLPASGFRNHRLFRR